MRWRGRLIGQTITTLGVSALVAVSLTTSAAASDPPRPAPAIESDTDGAVDTSPRGWTQRLAVILEETYGGTYAGATLKWVKCPKVESWDDGKGTDTQLCEYQFGAGTTRRSGSVVFQSDPDGASTYTIPYKRGPWSTRQKRCKAPAKRTYGSWRLTGISASGLTGCVYVRRLVEDVIAQNRNRNRFAAVSRTAFFGTNRAGFEEQISFRCVATRSRAVKVRVSCSNALKDRWSFTASRI